MTAKKLLIAIFILSLFISCDRLKKEKLADVQTAELKTRDLQQPAGPFQNPNTDSVIMAPASKPASNPDWDKKIIKTATLRMEVPDIKSYNQTVHKTIKQYGGYIAQEEQNLADERSETTISIKVPVEQFETMMEELCGTGSKILERKITTDDVTGEVVDIRSRLEAKKQMRLKYLEFLKQSKNITEVLQVQQEINGIQEQIESAANRVSFLSQQASFSTINLSFYQLVPGYKPTDSNPSFFTRVTIAFKSGVSWFADIFVALMSIWPLILVMIIAVIIWKRSKTPKPIRQNA